jgi:hypothetical protein
MYERRGRPFFTLARGHLKSASKRIGLRCLMLAALAMPFPALASGCGADSFHGPAPEATGAPAYKEDIAPVPLGTLFRGEGAQHAVILIGGIYNDYSYFSPWMKCLTGSGMLILGWQRPLHVRPLEESARALGIEMAKLHGMGVRRITLLAHSIGGLVAKGAVDRLARSKQAYRFERIDVHAFGTPWGGFPGGDLARSNPVGVFVSWLAGHPVWLDLGTGSRYVIHLDQPMPVNGRLYHYISRDDTVAWPGTEAAAQRYISLLENASAVIPLSGVDHDAYTSSRIDILAHKAEHSMLATGLLPKDAQQTSGSSD